MPGCGLLMLPCESPWKCHLARRSGWPMASSLGQWCERSDGSIHCGVSTGHVAESCRIGSPCLRAVFVGCGESNTQIFLWAIPPITAIWKQPIMSVPKSDGLAVLCSFFLTGVMVIFWFPQCYAFVPLSASCHLLIFITIFEDIGLTETEVWILNYPIPSSVHQSRSSFPQTPCRRPI